MTTNVQDPRLTNRPGEPTVVEPEPVIAPLGTGGVAVYDRGADTVTDPSLRAAIKNDPVPVEAQPTGSIMNWIIGVIVLVLVVYFLLQFIF